MLDLRHMARIVAIPSMLVFVVACSGYGGGAAVGSSAPSTGSGGGGRYESGDSASSPSTAASVEPRAGGTLQIGIGSGAAGTYLTAADGKTLYVFTKDAPSSSVCVDACATTWPPLTVPAGSTPTGVAGVTGSLTTFARADGTQQVAYDGKPLYYYAEDEKAGDAEGEGVGGVWFIAGP